MYMETKRRPLFILRELRGYEAGPATAVSVPSLTQDIPHG
jgi:hypothetical protein